MPASDHKVEVQITAKVAEPYLTGQRFVALHITTLKHVYVG